jgi:hypothetical protein
VCVIERVADFLAAVHFGLEPMFGVEVEMRDGNGNGVGALYEAPSWTE